MKRFCLRLLPPAVLVIAAGCANEKGTSREGATRADTRAHASLDAHIGSDANPVIDAAGRSLGWSTEGGLLSFKTAFAPTQSALSPAWLTGLDPLQLPVMVANGTVFGSQTGLESASHNFNDSASWLAGTFPPNQRASAVIHKEPGLSGGYQEVEILLRWSVGPLRTGLPFGDTHSHGYEINLAWDGEYVCIAQFKAAAMFDSLISGTPSRTLGVQDGDIFSAEIVGNTITATLTRHGRTVVLGTATDNSPAPVTTGTPGIGFFRGTAPGSTTNSRSFGFSSFTATALP